MDEKILKEVLKHFIHEGSIISLKLKVENLSEYVIFCWQQKYLEEIEVVSQKAYRVNANWNETSPVLLDYKTTLSRMMKL